MLDVVVHFMTSLFIVHFQFFILGKRVPLFKPLVQSDTLHLSKFEIAAKGHRRPFATSIDLMRLCFIEHINFIGHRPSSIVTLFSRQTFVGQVFHFDTRVIECKIARQSTAVGNEYYSEEIVVGGQAKLNIFSFEIFYNNP